MPGIHNWLRSTPASIAVDLSLGFLPYEQQAVEEAEPVENLGASFAVAPAEDLIIHKAISARERDWAGIEGIMAEQGEALNETYFLGWLRQFGQAQGRPELLERYQTTRQHIAKHDSSMDAACDGVAK